MGLGLNAQVSYTGWRITVFNLVLKKADKQKLDLQFDLANTGRYALNPNDGGVEQQRRLLIEFDTLNIDVRLLPHLEQLSETLRRSNLQLSVGAIARGRSLSLPLDVITPAPEPPAFIQPGRCPDLQIDSVFLFKSDSKALTFKVLLKNSGAVAAFFGNQAFNNYLLVYQSATPAPGRSATLITPSGIEGAVRELQPNAACWLEVRLDGLGKSTAFPWLVFQADPLTLIPECNRSNNTRAYLSE